MLKSGYPLRGRSDFSIDRLDLGPPTRTLLSADRRLLSSESAPATALALTQEEFAARFKIPLGTLRDWEQGRSEPDQPAKAYLTVIAHDPRGVERALHPVRR